jgi:hypothetical protein
MQLLSNIKLTTSIRYNGIRQFLPNWQLCHHMHLATTANLLWQRTCYGKLAMEVTTSIRYNGIRQFLPNWQLCHHMHLATTENLLRQTHHYGKLAMAQLTNSRQTCYATTQHYGKQLQLQLNQQSTQWTQKYRALEFQMSSSFASEEGRCVRRLKLPLNQQSTNFQFGDNQTNPAKTNPRTLESRKERHGSNLHFPRGPLSSAKKAA